MSSVITPQFIQKVLRQGKLADARRRFENHTAHVSHRDMSLLSNWTLICEEILDTEYSDESYDAIIQELIHRGFSFSEIDEMRQFAWESAGWLNYDKMHWEWCHLDEKDINFALKLQLEERKITQAGYDQGMQTLHRFMNRVRKPD